MTLQEAAYLMERHQKDRSASRPDQGRTGYVPGEQGVGPDAALAHVQREQKLQTIGLLTAGIAHDFNNLLTAILGHAELLTDSIPKGHPDRVSVDEIIAGSQQAVALASQLLAFSRPSPGELRPMDLNAVARETHSLLMRVLGARVRLELELEPALAQVRGDAAQLTQVLMNLVINARDALVAGAGRICIRTRNLERTGGSGAQVVLEVQDNGRGMDDVTQRRLFEPFFSRRSGGTGLGMSIVDAIVRAHDGRILVESELRRGSTISVVLPAFVQQH